MIFQGIDRLLSHFIMVAEKGGITKAAEFLPITQPALTRNIKLLESHLDVALFDRNSNGVKMTPYGQILARRTKLMQREFEQVISEMEILKAGRVGTIRIGAIPAWESIYIPEVISTARKELPGINFTVIGGGSSALMSMLRDGKLDLICTTLEFDNYPDILSETLLDMERVVVCRKNHPLTKQVVVAAGDLLKFPWGHIKGDLITFSRLGGYFSAYGLVPPKIDVECGSNMSLLSILRSTDLLSTAPKPFTEHTIFNDLISLPIHGSLWHYKTGIAYGREKNPPQFLTTFISYLREFILKI